MTNDPFDADPFNTGALRARVLDAWAASPSRFREDANAEEDYALGGYRDRVVVELAQNAADAAVRARVAGTGVAGTSAAGRLRLTLAGGVLTALNTGAPLDAAGVEALSTLRASNKRGDGDLDPGKPGETVGRFGVGFAAVVAVSDAPRIRSTTGTVGWSRDKTRDLVAADRALGDELAARSGHVPVLRLPFADADADADADDALPDGFATAVELPLRDDAAVELVTRLLAETGPALLLALPALTHVEITVNGTTRLLTAAHDGGLSTITVDGVPSVWRVASAGGALDPGLLADRPTEERSRTSWSVRWAVPVSDGGPSGRLPRGVAPVVHAPTPTDEPLSLPALLLASFPLSPDRRHVAPGPLTDFLVERAADAYADLLPELPAAPGLLDLVPGPVGRGELDARLASAIVARLPDVPFLPALQSDQVTEGEGSTDEVWPLDEAAPLGRRAGTARVRPRDALLLGTSAAGLAEYLAPVLPDLVDGPPRHPAWAVLKVRRMPLAELTDLVASLDRAPAWWRGLYAALVDVPVEERAELAALPVPLADGRLVRGPRGLLLPGPGLEHADRLAVLGLRVVDAVAAHPLLARLGAAEATPRSALEDPATHAVVSTSYDRAVEAYYDDDSPQLVADAVLGLVAAVDAEPGEYPWLNALALPGEDGDWYPAGELLLPDAPLAGVIADDAPFGTLSDDFAQHYDAKTLSAAGVLSSFGLLRAQDVELDEAAIDLELDDVDDWAADSRETVRLAETAALGEPGMGEPETGSLGLATGLPPIAVEVTAVRDLDLVDPARWPQALGLLTRAPLRAALTEPTRVRLPGGGRADVPSYTAWWLRRHLTLGGHRPTDLRAPDADPLLSGLYDAIDPDADSLLARLLGDPVIAHALGVRSSLDELLSVPGGADELLARLGDPARIVTRPQLRALWSALATADGLTRDMITPPDRVRAVHGEKLIVADARDALILDAPDLWPLVADQPLLLAPYQQAPRLADLLDLPLASEEVPGVIDSPGVRRPVPDIVRDVLPCAPATRAPATYIEHDSLTVDGADLPWRYADGELHTATVEGLAHGLAWAAGQWHARHLLAALLLTPEETARLLAESDLDDQ